jgi:hypothetical protein
MANQHMEEKNQTHRPFENREGAAARKFKTALRMCHPPTSFNAFQRYDLRSGLTERISVEFKCDVTQRLGHTTRAARFQRTRSTGKTIFAEALD